MRMNWKLAAGLTIISSALIFGASPDASQQHFVIVNDNDAQSGGSPDNLGTILKLTGSTQAPVLQQVASLNTGVPSFGSAYVPAVQVIASGSNICIFLSDLSNTTPNEISAFKYPGLNLVGNYNNAGIEAPGESVGAIAAHGGYLFASYSGYSSPNYIASWAIGPGCSLSLVQTYTVTDMIYSLAVMPNGVAVISVDDGSLDSFSIGPGGTLRELGPFEEGLEGVYGLDITSDSEYAVMPFSADDCYPENCYTGMMAYTINADGSIGGGDIWGGDGSGRLGKSDGIGYGALSPDEKHFYGSASTGGTPQMVTLDFTENPLNFSYGGCTTNLNAPSGQYAWSVATILPSGSGGGVYAAEYNAVAMLRIDSSTGCTTEVKGSPFGISDPHADVLSLVSWPPRPF